MTHRDRPRRTKNTQLSEVDAFREYLEKQCIQGSFWREVITYVSLMSRVACRRKIALNVTSRVPRFRKP